MKSYNNHEEFEKHVPYVYSNWCYIDSLDGKPFQDGERVLVEWMDGALSLENVVVVHQMEPYDDMGHTYEMPVDKAYLRVPVHGAAALISIFDAARKVERRDEE